MSPLVSIIMPVYNQEIFLEEAINSILECGYNNTEVLICDDCSVDQSYRKCEESVKKLRKKNIKTTLFNNEVNLGLIKTMRRLISLAGGEIICPLAGDDFILPNGNLTRIQPFIENPRIKLVIADGVAVNLESRTIVKSLGLENNILYDDFSAEKVAKTLALKWNYPLNIQCWKKDFFKVHGGSFDFEPNVFCEDLPAALWAGSRSEIAFCPIPCYGYRFRSWPQISSGSPHAQWKDMAFIYGKYSLLYMAKSREILRLAGERYYFLSIGETQLAEARLQQALALSQDT
jgi:glycosyltransferase involved in cell wall biosynthesis